MKIRVYSDIHLEFEDYTPPAFEDADVVVLAGDIGKGLDGLNWARKTFPNRPVVYIAGNHELYGHHWPGTLHAIQHWSKDSNVWFLLNTSTVINGVRFLGCTLWTDFWLDGKKYLSQYVAGKYMNDYRQIKLTDGVTELAGKERLHPTDTAKAHEDSIAWMKRKFEEGFDGPTVVVTHHAPSGQSISPMHSKDELNPAYASRLEEFILEHKPVLWIHGHMHHHVNYRIGDTLVYSNPRGYPKQLVTNGFDPGRNVELSQIDGVWKANVEVRSEPDDA